MIQEAEVMGMDKDKEIILHLRHSMIWESTRLLVVPAVEVGVMVDREFVLIVLLSMRVVGRIVISVDYLSMGRQEKNHQSRGKSEYEVSHV
jgi:hypothetical protein